MFENREIYTGSQKLHFYVRAIYTHTTSFALPYMLYTVLQWAGWCKRILLLTGNKRYR